MKYSIVFTEYDPDGKFRDFTIMSLLSVIENSRDDDFELIHVKNVKGYSNAMNEGFTRAKGDYIIHVSNDVIIEDRGWLKAFTVDNVLSAWRLVPFVLTGKMRPDFACFGMSRAVFERIGLFDTIYNDGYGYDDDDYIYTATKVGVEFRDASIKLRHLEAMTFNGLWSDEKQGRLERNKLLFKSKWNI